MEKDYDKWNKEKKLINGKLPNRDLFFHTREIWWCSAGLNIGVEVDGKNDNFERPILIVKKFNAEMIWALPLTRKERLSPYYFKLKNEIIESSLILSQLKTISTKRLLPKVGSISESEYMQIVSKLMDMLKIENPTKGVFSEAEATNNQILV